MEQALEQSISQMLQIQLQQNPALAPYKNIMLQFFKKHMSYENLKVFGVENLHLVSNSVFPHMGSNPPTLTIAALALKLAAHLETTK